MLLLDVNSDRSDSYLKSLEFDHSLITSNGTVFSVVDRAKVFVDFMGEQFTFHRYVFDPTHSAEVTDFISNYFRPPQHTLNPLAEMTFSPLSATSTVDVPPVQIESRLWHCKSFPLLELTTYLNSSTLISSYIIFPACGK